MRSLVAISPAVTAGIAEDLKLKRDSFVAPLLPPSARTLHLYAAIRRLAALKGTDDELAIQTVANLMTIDRPPATLEPGRAERRRVTDVARRLRSDYAEPITLDEMADQANLSRYHFIRVFKQVIGESPRKYLVAARLRAAVDRLLETREPVISVALNTGFNDISHFTNTFRTAIGVSPRRLRAGA
jgi:transcriptional regulator GlxA family with amidase domain